MTPRERILTTLAHKEPDRVPLTAAFWPDTRIKLKKYYGVKTDEELYEKIGAGYKGQDGFITVYRLMPRGWKPAEEYLSFCEATGYENPEYEYADFEEWGVQRKLGAKHGRSLTQSYLFTRHPWESLTTPKQVEDLRLPDLDASGRFDEAKKIIDEKKDSYLIIGHFRILWMRLVYLRGMLTVMKDLHTNPEMTEAFLDKLLDYSCRLADKFIEIGCDGIRVSEDLGNNYSLFFSPMLWRKYFKPRYKKLIDRVKRRGKFFFWHSCGNITPIIGDLVEIGIDSLNPVQPECIDQLDIKRRYGDKITIDTGLSVQRTLSFGTVEDVRREVLHALKHLAPGGGFIYGTSHYAMYEVPVENVVALYETCREYGKYPIRIPE